MIEHLGSYMKTRKVPRGATIFAKGDPGTGLMGVLAGSVKVSVASAEGKDIVLNIFREGEVFGEIALLDGRPRTADATAMSDCELIVIERRDFVPFLSNHPDVTIKFIEILCSRLRRTSEQVQDVTFLNLPTRLAKRSLQLTSSDQGGAPGRKVAITQREISQMIGRSQESTNKQLRAWVKRGGFGSNAAASAWWRRTSSPRLPPRAPISIRREATFRAMNTEYAPGVSFRYFLPHHVLDDRFGVLAPVP